MASTLILETTAYTLDQLTSLNEPQIAFAGRSNVGKSSLINALARRNKLAKTSATPGKTRSVNYYRVVPEDFIVVDLPGYGYAQCSKEERKKWAKLIEKYIVSCQGLKALAVLLDSRLDPQRLDVELTTYAQAHNIPLLPILTKGDKCNQRERSARQKQWAALLGGQKPVITASKNGLGIQELWKELKICAGCMPEVKEAEPVAIETASETIEVVKPTQLNQPTPMESAQSDEPVQSDTTA